MKMINSRELNINTAQVLKEARKHDLIITVKGKPTALIQAFDESDLEDYVLAQLVRTRLKRRAADFTSSDRIGLDEMIEAAESAVGG